MDIRVQEQAFDPGGELSEFATGRHDLGALVSFTGVVRDPGGLQYMEIEHYPAMTARAIEKIAGDAMARWRLGDVMVVHRYGRLAPGAVIMMVATAAPHRKDAFEAAEYLMDYLKSRAPFWKKEVGTNGAEWVAAKDDDEAALTRW